MRTVEPSAQNSISYYLDIAPPAGYKLHSWRSETALYDATVIVMWVRKDVLPLATMPDLPADITIPALLEWGRRWLTKHL